MMTILELISSNVLIYVMREPSRFFKILHTRYLSSVLAYIYSASSLQGLLFQIRNTYFQAGVSSQGIHFSAIEINLSKRFHIIFLKIHDISLKKERVKDKRKNQETIFTNESHQFKYRFCLTCTGIATWFCMST